jgi:hypothetical protein
VIKKSDSKLRIVLNLTLAVELLHYGHVEVRARVARSTFVFIVARLAVYQGGLLS